MSFDFGFNKLFLEKANPTLRGPILERTPETVLCELKQMMVIRNNQRSSTEVAKGTLSITSSKEQERRTFYNMFSRESVIYISEENED